MLRVVGLKVGVALASTVGLVFVEVVGLETLCFAAIVFWFFFVVVRRRMFWSVVVA